jgi:hypothetical protein
MHQSGVLELCRTCGHIKEDHRLCAGTWTTGLQALNLRPATMREYIVRPCSIVDQGSRYPTPTGQEIRP